MFRGRPRRVGSPISVRVGHAVLGVLAAVVWLMLPGMTSRVDDPVAVTGDGPVASAAAQEEDDTSAADLVLPLVAGVAAVAVAGYGYVRRTRRARSRTTPGGAPVRVPGPAPGELDERSVALLVEADDWVRTSREELSFTEALSGTDAVAPWARAVRDAEAELAAAFHIRRRYDNGVPEDDSSRRHALAGIVGRCEEVGRRLDAEAAGFDQLRGLEGGVGEALGVAETWFRESAARTGGADASLVDLGKRYGPSAVAGVTGYVEQAKDRLVFATSRLNQSRQSADRGETERAIGSLRAAEGAVAQAAVLVDGIDRLAVELAAAADLVAPALTGAEAEIAGAREPRGDVPVGELHARIAHADAALAAVREEVTGGPYDPLGALRRIVEGVAPLAGGRAGVVGAAASLVARSATAAADDCIATHRGAVGGPARVLLAEAQRLLGSPVLADLRTADTLGRRARDLAEQDVRLHGHPLSGAALGGILLDGGAPASFGGPYSRARREGDLRTGSAAPPPDR
ncbi:hypothetical protein AB0I00_20430 [Streptomyces sp. NPDC050803]|uniref:hypothetical protein n=1 Tax=unclassified Streptomyces TaxID=2593676 RepID=UPI003442E2B7